MSHTVIGIFTVSEKAQEAADYLVANGFDRGDIDIRTSQVAGTNVASTEVDVVDPVGDFFRGIFGNSVSDAERYTEAGRNGTIVTVHALSGEQADVAARILDNYGAADVDEHADGDAPLTGESRLRSRIIDRRLEDGMRLRAAANRPADHPATDVDVDAFNKNAL